MRSTVLAALVAAVAVAVPLLVGAEVVFGQFAEKEVAGTKHDVATPGIAPCEYCHLPSDSQEELVWARDPNAGRALSGQRALCFSCHDGTVTAKGVYAFNPAREMHVREPGVRGRDCDLCHDPHEAKEDSFLKVAGHANFCQSCHGEAGPEDHPVDVSARIAGIEPHDGTWDPENGDYSGTRLWNADGTGPGEFVKCMSCHATHGGEPNTDFNTMPFESSHDAFLPLCLNCHAAFGEN